MLFAAAVTIPLSSCSSHPGQAGAGGWGASSSWSPAACRQRDIATQAETQVVLDQARALLEADGVRFDGRVWNEPAQFEAFMQKVDRVTGCALMSAEVPPSESATAAERASALAGTDAEFCGPGSQGPYHPRVDRALNEICQAHDACYAACSGPTLLACAWVPATRPCDDVFLAAIDALPAGRTGVDQWLPLLLPRALLPVGEALGAAACLDPATTCPASVDGGQGVCAHPETADEHALCAACADQYDPGASWRDSTCPADDSPLCWASQCVPPYRSLAACFGGWDEDFWHPPSENEPASPGSNGTGARGDDPPGGVGSHWRLELLELALPTTDSPGVAWDDDGTPPDPLVSVRVGDPSSTAQLTTPTSPDTFTADLTGQSLPNLTGARLVEGLSASAFDEDGDASAPKKTAAGSCVRLFSLDEYTADELEMTCKPTAHSAGFRLRFRLKPTP